MRAKGVLVAMFGGAAILGVAGPAAATVPPGDDVVLTAEQLQSLEDSFVSIVGVSEAAVEAVACSVDGNNKATCYGRAGDNLVEGTGTWSERRPPRWSVRTYIDADTIPTSTTETPPPPTTTPPPVVTMPSGAPVFPGYPLVVDVSTLDYRVASWFEGQLVDGQVVALAPGVYTPYNPAVPDLLSYLTGPNDGDCVVREQFFPNAGGACWSGVLPGAAEPTV